ncbi:MAG: hypothetical protein E7312_02820 [Clostridiales bacterium]|nr:hypothetical protein [Clostridiales bacterium]
MKKLISILLAVLILCGCTAQTPTPSQTVENSPTPSTSQSPNVTVTPNTTLGPTSTPNPTPTPDNTKVVDSFEVSYEVYKDYNNNNVVIVNVKNTANTPKNIELTGEFLDESGQTQQTQTQKFEGFAANWSNYFVFNTNVNFTTADFDIKSTEFSGEVLSNHIHAYKGGVILQIDKGNTLVLLEEATDKEIKKAKAMRVRLAAYATLSGIPLTAYTTCVLIDNKGRVYFQRTFKFFNLGGISNPYLGFGPICGDSEENPDCQDNSPQAAYVLEHLNDFIGYKSFMSVTSVEKTVIDMDEFNEAVKENEKNNK